MMDSIYESRIQEFDVKALNISPIVLMKKLLIKYIIISKKRVKL